MTSPPDRRIFAVTRRAWVLTPRGVVAAFAIALLFAPSATALDVEAERLDGRRAQGELVSVAPELVLHTADGDESLPWAELLSVRPIASAATQPTTRPTSDPAALIFTLADQSRFSARLIDAQPADFAVALADGQQCRLDLTMLRSLRRGGAEPSAMARFDEALHSPESADAAVVARGDEALTLRGTVKHIDTERVLFTWNDRDVALPWPSVVGVVFARPAARTASHLLRTRDGEIYAGRVTGGGAESVTVQSAAFERLTLPWSRIERIECRSQKLIFLSELTPARYDFEPFFDKNWDYGFDRTFSGRPIRLGQREYPRGVTLHSKATLMYRLGGEYRQFAATAGICDEMGPRGAVMLRVLGDGRVLWESRSRGGEPPQDVLVNVAQVDELSLQVDYDEALDLGDQACWAFARLIK